MRHAVRSEGRTYATRRSDGHRRFMGGINVFFSGDWWQIPPVRQTSLTANPFLKHPPGVARVLQVFWRRDGPDSLTSVHELEEPQRCQDRFLNACLEQCRSGHLCWTSYNFLHGWSTFCPGSWLPGLDRRGDSAKETFSGSLSCGSSGCDALWRTRWPQMFAAGKSWTDMVAMECHTCAAARPLRHCRRPLDGRAGEEA